MTWYALVKESIVQLWKVWVGGSKRSGFKSHFHSLLVPWLWASALWHGDDMVLGSWDCCWFKWDHVCGALSRVPGTLEASINARLATAIKLPPLLLLFQDTTAPARRDSLLYSACPASALMRHFWAPHRMTRITVLTTTVTVSPAP